MLIKAPAKINLTLKILSKRADGYHEISSLMRAIRLFDEVEIVLGAGGGAAQARGLSDVPIRVQTDMEGVPGGRGNIAYRAAELALARWGKGVAGRQSAYENRGAAMAENRGLNINIKKNIPVAAGLAGGSADAAAVLLGLANMLCPGAGANTAGVGTADIDAACTGMAVVDAAGVNAAGVDIEAVAALGAELGADIPFCVYSCAAANPALAFVGAPEARAEGIGEIITPVTAPARARVVLVKPHIEIPTKEAYALYDAREAPALAALNMAQKQTPITESRLGASQAYVSENDFEALCTETWPVIAETLKKLKAICADEGASGAKVQLSGSGPTVFAWLKGRHEAAADNIYARAKAAFTDMLVYLTDAL